MAYNQGAVVSHSYPLDDFWFTYYISGTVTQADVGKAVTIDTTAASTMKLSGDNDVVHGRLETYEDRAVLGIKVGTVSRKFKSKLPAAIGHGITVGQTVTGSGTAGLVKVATSQANPTNHVIETGTDFVVVEKL